MIIEFEDKLILNEEEKKALKPTFVEAARSFQDDPESTGVYIDRIMDDLSNILKAREWTPSGGVFMKPDDKGDNPDGTINVNTD